MTTFRTLLARLDLARRQWAERHLNPACDWANTTGSDDDD